MSRNGFLIGFLAGGWLATILVLLLPHLGIGLGQAVAEDPPGTPQPIGVDGSVPVGPSVNPVTGDQRARGIVNPGIGTSDANRRSIALAASIGSGQAAVYYFDTVAQRLCVYQYQPGTRGGLKLLAARLIDFDLRLESYRDISEKTPREMRAAYEAAMQGDGKKGGRGGLPTKRVNAPGGMR